MAYQLHGGMKLFRDGSAQASRLGHLKSPTEFLDLEQTVVSLSTPARCLLQGPLAGGWVKSLQLALRPAAVTDVLSCLDT